MRHLCSSLPLAFYSFAAFAYDKGTGDLSDNSGQAKWLAFMTLAVLVVIYGIFRKR